MDKAAVAILNWNGRELLEAYLPSVVTNSQVNGVTVYVIDNGSTDDSVAFINSRFPSVKVIKLERNYGFAGGYNKGLKQIDAEYFVLLNSDVEVTDGWIDPLINTLDSSPDIGACQPKLKSFLHRDHFEYAGAAGGYIDKYGFPFCRGRFFNVFEKDCKQYEKTEDIFWASGACLFIRSKIYFETGGLDADFFAHMEEIDLCWRMHSRGYRVVYQPLSTVYHLGGATLNKTNPHKTYLNFRNNLYLLFKNTPKGKLRRLLFVRMILDGIAAIKFLFGFDFRNFYAVLHAHLQFYLTIYKFKNRRRDNLKAMSVFKHSTIYKKSIVADFFLRNKKYFSELNFKP